MKASIVVVAGLSRRWHARLGREREWHGRCALAAASSPSLRSFPDGRRALKAPDRCLAPNSQL